jgi:hypothetical protein
MVSILNLTTFLTLLSHDHYTRKLLSQLPIRYSGYPMDLNYKACFTSNCGNVTFILDTTLDDSFRICPSWSPYCDPMSTHTYITPGNGTNIVTITADFCDSYTKHYYGTGWDDPKPTCLFAYIRTNGEEIKINSINATISLHPITFGRPEPSTGIGLFITVMAIFVSLLWRILSYYN